MSTSKIVNKVPALPAGRWNYAHVLRDDGVPGEYAWARLAEFDVYINLN